MNISIKTLLRGLSWTTGAYTVSQCLRFLNSIVLARLLAPELFGIINIVNTVRTGIGLISDIGISQNMVQYRNSDDPSFYNTVWSLQLIRGVILWVFSFAAAVPLAHFYQSPILAYVLPIAALPFLFGGANSMGPYIAQKRMQFIRLNVFEVILDVIATAVSITFAFLSPTIWALVFSGVIIFGLRTFAGYFIIPGIRHRFHISKDHARQIFSLSKWIFVSSIILFLSMNFDTLYIGKITTFKFLGIYGIARTLSGQIGEFVNRLNNIFVFPLVASAAAMPRIVLRKQISSVRLIFLLGVAAGLSVLAATGDMLIAIFYDQRYQAAGWIFPILIVGSWFSILSSINEAILIGLGKPSYGAIANSMKFGWLLIGLPIGFTTYGAVGVVMVVAASDLWRYLPILIGQARERFSFAMQDLIATFTVFGLIGFWEVLRSVTGLGISQFHLIP